MLVRQQMIEGFNAKKVLDFVFTKQLGCNHFFG